MVEDYQDNYGTGWISLYRSLKHHWVWSDPVKLKWWLIVLFEVNHRNNKVAIGYNLVECKRGQSLKSLRSWSSEFGVSVKSVVRFFDMLEKDEMIKRETVGKGQHSTTMLTVCNYDTYQNKKQEKETQEPHNGNATETQGQRNGGTNNKDNNSNNENKDYRELRFREQVAQHTQYNSQMLEAFSDYWTESKPNGKKMKFEMQKTFDIERRLKTWNRNDFGTKEKETNTVTGSIRDLGLNPINRR